MPGGALTASVVKLTLSTWDAACLMSSTIWFSSVSVWSRVTAVPPVYSASSVWQPFVVNPSPQKMPVGLYVTNERFVFCAAERGERRLACAGRPSCRSCYPGLGRSASVFGHAGKSVLMLASCGSESPSTTMKRGVEGAQLSESSWNAS